jgi:hypothetical protein
VLLASSLDYDFWSTSSLGRFNPVKVSYVPLGQEVKWAQILLQVPGDSEISRHLCRTQPSRTYQLRFAVQIARKLGEKE